MAGYIDLEELQGRVYFKTATLDHRYTWEEIHPGPDYSDVAETDGDTWVWSDGTSRFKLVDCKHLDVFKDGALCTHCGHEDPYEDPPEQAAKRVVKKRAVRKPRK